MGRRSCSLGDVGRNRDHGIGLAAVSVYARKSAIALASQLADGGRWLPRTLDAVAMLGGILIILLGLGLLHASLSIARHPLL